MSAKKTIHEHFFTNGLKLIIKEDHRAPVAIMQVWYKVGSSYEHNGITGISHALEHMMFRGSKNYRNTQYDEIISENGGQNNAFTGQDYTVYHQFIANDKLEICFKLEADRMHQLLLNEQDFKKEISVVMEERYMSIDDSPEHRAYERFAAIAHTSSPYRHSIIGWMDDLKQMTVADLKQWYHTWYAPNNAIVIVVGDVQPKQIQQWTKKYFGSISARSVPIVKPQNEVQALGTRCVTIKVPAKLPWLALGYNTPVLKTAATNKQWEPYALWAASSILGLNSSSRLQKNILRKKQIASSAYAHYSPFDRMNNILMLGLTPNSMQDVEKCKKALLEEIDNLQNQLIRDKELERVKIAWIASKIFSTDSLFHQAYEIGMLECVGFSWAKIDRETIKKIRGITPKQIQDVALNYLTPERLTIGILEPLEIKANNA
ncbi:MAG: peptidase family [Gammaproteobacteria bacterium]|jgi:zinc protease|nr:peptidase family [Gammaproteobacteria bacterium]